MNLPVYYVSAHSKIPKRGGVYIDRIPDNTYLIMTAECGRYASVENQNFLSKWISTPEGTERLKDLVRTGTHPLSINGKFVYGPGKEGPINQVLEFAKSAVIRDTFYLGITRAPVNLRKIRTDALSRIRRLPKEKLVKAFKAVKKIYDIERSNSNAENEEKSIRPEDMSPMAIVTEISFMVSNTVGGWTGKNVSTEQLEKVIRSPEYRMHLMVLRDVPFEYIIQGNKSISKLLKEDGSGIYIIDACRGIAKIEENLNGTTTVFPSKKQRYRENISFPVGTFSTYVNPKLSLNNRRLIENRLEYARVMGNYYRRKERGENPPLPSYLINRPVNMEEI